MKSRKTVELPAVNTEKMICELGLLIVSMDRIGSTYYDEPDREAAAMSKYFADVKALRLLANARAILSKAYYSQNSKAKIMRLEEKAEKMRYWQPSDFGG